MEWHGKKGFGYVNKMTYLCTNHIDMENQVIYDPAKSYTWTPEDTFVFKGGEFGFLFNSLIKEEAELLRKLELINVMKSKLKEAVEAGVAKERESPQSA